MATKMMPATLRGMSTRLERDAEFREEFLANPQAVLDEAAEHVPNTPVYRWVVGSLGVALILCLLASFAVLIFGQSADGTMPEVPDIFVTATSTIIGALAGLLLPQS